MKNPMQYFSWFTEKMYDLYSNDCGKLLVHMGAASYAFGAVAQIGSLLASKEIDSKQKKFLLPQEVADAAVNIGLFYTICQLSKSCGDYFVEKGALITDDVAKAIAKIKPSNMPALSMKNWKKVFKGTEVNKNLTDLLSNAENLSTIKKASAADKTKMLENAEAALKAVKSHKNNVGTITSIAASILATNILTPIARNHIAADVQQMLQHKEDVEIRKTQIRDNITLKNMLPTSFKAFNNFNSFSGVKI